MIAKTLVFVCAAFGLVAGSCFEIRAPQDCSSQIISVPVQSESSFATPVVSDNVFSSGSSNLFSESSAQVVATPVVSEPVYTAPVVSDNVYSSGSSSGNTFSEIFSSGSSGSSSSGISFGSEATNGPDATPVTFVQAPAVTLPAVEGPTITLSSQPIPAPRVLSQRCICTKTVVKPQVIQRTVTVPKIQRYLKRTVTPVVENVSYKSTPITQGSSFSGSNTLVISGSGSSSGSNNYVISGSSSSSSPVVFSTDSGSCGSQSARYVSAPIVVSSGSSCPRFY